MSYAGLPDRTRIDFPWRPEDGPYADTGFDLHGLVKFLRLTDPITIETTLSSLIAAGPASAWSYRVWEEKVTPIDPMQLGERPVYNLETSDITASSEMPGITWIDVRIILFVETPDAARLVDGMLLKDVFLDMVMRDVLVEHERDGLKSIDFKHEDGTPMLRGDPTFGLHYFSKIEVCSEKNGIASHIQETACARNQMSSRDYAATGLSRYFARIAERSARLIAKLRAGDILAFGQPDKGKDRIEIDPHDWQRPGLAVDFERGDLIDLKRGVIEWRSIRLVAPAWAKEPENPQMPDPMYVAAADVVQQTPATSTGRSSARSIATRIYVKEYKDGEPSKQIMYKKMREEMERLGYRASDSTIRDGVQDGRIFMNIDPKPKANGKNAAKRDR